MADLAVKIEEELSAQDTLDSMRDKLSNRWLENKDYIWLQREYKRGNTEASKLAIESVVKLLYSVAKNYEHLENTDDLAHEGVFGVVSALDKYEPNRKCKFTSYAFWWVRQSIVRHLKNSGHIRIPVYLNEAADKVEKYSEKHLMMHGKEPSDEEISEATEVPIAKIREINKLQLVNPIYLNSKIGDGVKELIDFQPSESVPSPDSRDFIIKGYSAFLVQLTPQQQKVITYRHGFDKGGNLRTFREVASMIPKEDWDGEGRETISRVRAHQLYTQGIKKMESLLSGPESSST